MQMKAGEGFNRLAGSALAFALGLGLVGPVQAEDWTGYHLTFGLSGSATEILPYDVVAYPQGTDLRVAPYAAFGHDWARGDLTFGLLADVDTAGLRDGFNEGKGFFGEADWFATIRGRVGMPVNDQTRFYVSGGVAVAQYSSTIIGLPEVGAARDSQFMTGPALGLALEYALSPGRSLTVEYLHANFGDKLFHDGALARNGVIDAFRVGYTFRF